MFACSTTWPVPAPVVGSAPIPPEVTPTVTAFAIKNLVVTLDYFVQIHTD